MDKYLVAPFSRWIVHSTGWALPRATIWARIIIVTVFVVVATYAFFTIRPDRYLP